MLILFIISVELGDRSAQAFQVVFELLLLRSQLFFKLCLFHFEFLLFLLNLLQNALRLDHHSKSSPQVVRSQQKFEFFQHVIDFVGIFNFLSYLLQLDRNSGHEVSQFDELLDVRRTLLNCFRDVFESIKQSCSAFFRLFCNYSFKSSGSLMIFESQVFDNILQVDSKERNMNRVWQLLQNIFFFFVVFFDFLFEMIDVFGILFIFLINLFNYLIGSHLENFDQFIKLTQIITERNDCRLKSFLQLDMKILQPNILINLAFQWIISIGSSEISFLLLFLEDLQQYLLLNFRNSIDFLHHSVEYIHDGPDEVVDSCCIVEARIIKGSHQVGLKERNMDCIVLHAWIDHRTV